MSTCLQNDNHETVFRVRILLKEILTYAHFVVERMVLNMLKGFSDFLLIRELRVNFEGLH